MTTWPKDPIAFGQGLTNVPNVGDLTGQSQVWIAFLFTRVHK